MECLSSVQLFAFVSTPLVWDSTQETNLPHNLDNTPNYLGANFVCAKNHKGHSIGDVVPWSGAGSVFDMRLCLGCNVTHMWLRPNGVVPTIADRDDPLKYSPVIGTNWNLLLWARI